MPFVDDPNDNQENTGVAGAAPLSQGTPSQPMQDSENMSQQAASGPAVGSEAPAQQAATNKSAKKASSGMFNNIQKYVNKNRPQAQKMAGAVTSDVSKQAGEIRQAAEAKQAQQNQAIQANKDVMEQNRTFAQGQVDNIMNPIQQTQATQSDTGRGLTAEPAQQASTTQTPTEDNQQKFQDLMSGKIQGYNKAQDLNLAQQQNKSAALKSLAQGANTEQGRRNLLGETFQKQGAYTRGQSGLDQLITSGDQAARESLIQGTQATAKGLSDDLGNISQTAAGNLAAQQEQKNQFGEDVTNMATGAGTDIDASLEQSYKDEIERRGNLTGDYSASKAEMEAWKADKLAQLGDVEDWQNIAGQISNSGYDLGSRGRNTFASEAEGNITLDENGNPTRLNRISEDKFRDAMKSIMGGYQYGDDNLTNVYGADEAWSNIWGDSSSSNASTADQYFNRDTIQDQFRNMKSSIEGIDPETFLQQQFTKGSGGQSLADYQAGTGLDKYDTASQANIDKIKALQSLTGAQEYSDDMRNTDYADNDAMQALLKKYGKA